MTSIKRERIFPLIHVLYITMHIIICVYYDIQEAGTLTVIRRAARISQPSRLPGDLH